MGKAGSLRNSFGFVGVTVLTLLLMSAFVGQAEARKVDNTASKAGTIPVNLQITPTDAYLRIRDWTLPAPLLPMSVFGAWGGRGTVSGDGSIRIPSSGVAAPTPFQFTKDFNGQDKTVTVALSSGGDWTGSVNPLNGQVNLNMPMRIRVTADHIRLKKVVVWIYGNLDCSKTIDFNPMTTGHMGPTGDWAPVAPVTDGSPYNPATGQFNVINNSMAIGGFPRCDHPDIGGGTAADELSEAMGLPAAPGKTDVKINMTFLQGGTYSRPQPAIRPSFTAAADANSGTNLDASASYAKAGAAAYVWDFNNDGTADQTTTVASIGHPYATTGEKTIGLRVKDKEGDLSGWVKQTVTVVPATQTGPGGPGGETPNPHGRCLHLQKGTQDRDRIIGTKFGDRLLGRAGHDLLKGRKGNDCLQGGPGRDRLIGGPGKDKLNGGKGKDKLNGGTGKDKLIGAKGRDKLNGGKGRDWILAGAGNDLIFARDGKRDLIDCGSGRKDRVKADRRDRVKRCEIVKRSNGRKSG